MAERTVMIVGKPTRDVTFALEAHNLGNQVFTTEKAEGALNLSGFVAIVLCPDIYFDCDKNELLTKLRQRMKGSLIIDLSDSTISLSTRLSRIS